MINHFNKQPAYLKKGDAVGIVAPAGIVNSEDIEPAVEILKEWGLNVVKGRNLYQKFNFFAGTDTQRISDFQNMLDNKEIKAIFFARGGYGSIRIIDKLDFKLFKKYPKWLIGYSDITMFHIYLSKILKYESLHAIMPKNFLKGKEDNQSLAYLKELLFGTPDNYQIEYNKLNRQGKASGLLTGGNLSIIYSLQATKYEIETKGKILFIEEVSEYLYHFERMLINLKMSGKLDDIKGLIVGGMTDMKDTTPGFGKDSYEIIADLVKEYDYPVIYGFPAGHMYPNLPLIMGRKIKIEVSENRAVVLLNG